MSCLRAYRSKIPGQSHHLDTASTFPSWSGNDNRVQKKGRRGQVIADTDFQIRQHHQVLRKVAEINMAAKMELIGINRQSESRSYAVKPRGTCI